MLGGRSTFVLVVTWWLLDYLVTFKFCVTAVCIDRIDCDTLVIFYFKSFVHLRAEQTNVDRRITSVRLIGY